VAVVGSAYVMVRAITDKVEGDIQRAFSRSTRTAYRSGGEMGNALTRGLNRGARQNKFNALADQLRELYPEAERSAEAFTRLVRRGYVAQTAIGALAGSVGALVGGLGALIGSVGAAVPALIGLGSAAITARVGLGIATFALGDVGSAVEKATDATSGLSESVEDLTKKYEDLLFAAEDAALGEERAALNLEKARENLLRTADLAPNSRVRREASLAFKEAELAYRKAIANREDLNDQVNKGIDGLRGGGAGSDPFAGLTDSQRAFAEFLVSIAPIQEELKEAAASGFLPILEEQMKRIIDSGLPVILKDRFYDLGVAVGGAVENFTDILLARDNLQKLDDVLGDMAENIPIFGSIFGNLFDALLTAVKEADPLTRRFLEYLDDKAGSWATFLDIKAQTGELEAFFTQAGDNAAKLGEIFGQTFDFIVNMVAANFTPGTGGWKILDWLDEITGAWADADQAFLETYFSRSADNFIAIGNALGGAFETLIRLGANPAVAEFWEALDEGSYEFSQLLTAMVESAPALGEILSTLTGIIAAFTDSGVPQTFLETLNYAFQGIEEIVNALKPLLDNVVGQAFAVLSAFGLLFTMLGKIGLVGTGFIIRLLTYVGLIAPAAGSATAVMGGLSRAALAATATVQAALLPFLPLAAVIGGVVAAVTLIVAEHGKRMEKATSGITDAFEDGADAATVWEKATLAVPNGIKDSIKSIDQMKEKIGGLAKAQENYIYSNGGTTALADSFGAIGRSLADIAVTDLPRAQEQLRRFGAEVGLSKDELIVAIDEMDEYKEALIDQADQMGITIHNMDGTIDKQKLVNLAIGEGEVAIRQQLAAAEEANIEMERIRREEKARFDAAVGELLDLDGALSRNKDATMAWAIQMAEDTEDASDSWEDYYDGQSFNLEVYLQQLEDQLLAEQNWKDNLAELHKELPADVYAQVEEMGQAGAALVQALVDGTDEEKQKFIDLYGQAGEQAAAALGEGINEELKTFSMYDSITPNIRRIMNTTGLSYPFKDGGLVGAIQKFSTGGIVSGLGTARSDSIPAMLSNGEYVVNARATSANRDLLDAINNNQKIRMGSNVNVTVNPAPGMNERELAEVVSRRIAFEIRKGSI